MRSGYPILLIGFIILLLLASFWHSVEAGSTTNFSAASHQSDSVLPFGQPVTGTLNAVLPERLWTFEAALGTRAGLSLIRTSGDAKMTLMLFNQTGTLIVSLSTDLQGNASVPQLYLEGGTYTLRLVADFTTGVTESDYELLLASNSPAADTTTPAPTTLPTTPDPASGIIVPIGTSLEGEFTSDGERDTYSFPGVAGTRITFGLSRIGAATLDPYLELQAPGGSIIASADNYLDSLDVLIINFPLPETGQYTLFASSATGQGMGRYLLSIGTGFILRDVQRGVAAHNEPMLGQLEAYGTRDVWLIEAVAGDSLSISIEKWGTDKDSAFDPMVELVSPTGETLAFDDDSGANKNAILIGIRAPVTGTYHIHVAAYSHATIGNYRLWWQRDNLFPTPTPSPITPTPPITAIATQNSLSPSTPAELVSETPPLELSGSGSELDDIDPGETLVRQIALESGQELTLFVEGHSGFDGVLEIYTPDGYMLDRVDDIGFDQTFDIDPRLTLVAQENGIYTLKVYGYEHSAGEFTLHWRVE